MKTMQPFTRSIRWAVALLVLLTALPSQSFAQAKIKVAIWEFENHAETHYWYSGMLGPAARDQIDTEFSENPALSSKFSVIERDKLALVLKEQGLATSGAVDPSSAAKVGKILGVKYIILGGVDKFVTQIGRCFHQAGNHRAVDEQCQLRRDTVGISNVQLGDDRCEPGTQFLLVGPGGDPAGMVVVRKFRR